MQDCMLFISFTVFFYTCLPECLYATYVPHDCGVLERTRDALKLKLQKAVNPYVDAGN